MPTLTTRHFYKFKNEGSNELNDVAFPGGPFVLDDHTYKFIIQPRSPFWRFGIRFSKSAVIEYNPTSRYGNSSYQHLQVIAGETHAQGTWSNPNRLELEQYYMDNVKYPNPLSSTFSYTEKQAIALELRYEISTSTLEITYIIQDSEPITHRFEIEGLTHFNFSCWADWIAFEVDCLLLDIVDNLEGSDVLKIGNVAFHKVDMFNRLILDEVDAIVVPISSAGAIQPSIENAANLLQINNPGPGQPGTIIEHAINRSNEPAFWIWAYSVASSIGSSLQIINDICSSVVTRFSNEKNDYTIAWPLLGTGFGKLDVLNVAKLYCEKFGTTSNLLAVVSVNTNERFEAIFRYFTSVEVAEELESFFIKTPLIIRERRDISPVLDVEELGKQISEVLMNIPAEEKGPMIGIFGRWGRGKSYLMDKITEELEKYPNNRRIDFHAWKYQDTPAIHAYLFEQFAEKYYAESNYWLGKFLRRIRLNYNRVGLERILTFLIPFGLSFCFSFFVTLEQKWHMLQNVIGILSVSGIIAGLILFFRYRKSAMTLFADFSRRVSFFKQLGFQAEVQKELKILVKTWCKDSRRDRLFLFVDDIDRCSETKILEIIDALRVMLEDTLIARYVTIVAAIDEDILQHAIRYKYRSLLINDKEHPFDLNALTCQYLDKLFIMGIKLGHLSGREKDDFLLALTKSDRDDTTPPAYIDDELPNNTTTIIQNVSATNVTPSVMASQDNAISLQQEFEPQTVQPTIATKEGTVRSSTLSTTELEALREGLKRHADLTPRQIRIFYYRYVLTKSLLLVRYTRSGKYNPWLTGEHCRSLINLLMDYSLSAGRKKLTEHKMSALQTQTTSMPYHLYPGFNVKTEHYRELLKILDVVIAY